jgi:hypothetical protein
MFLNGSKNRDTLTCAYAAALGRLELLKWLRSQGCPWNESTCRQAVMSGKLEVLNWARCEWCSWSAFVCEDAAEYGHLDLIKWARGVYGTTWSVQKLRKEGTLSFFSGLDHKTVRGIVEKCQQQLRKVTCISSNGHLRMIALGAIWSTHSRLSGETLRFFSWFGLMDSHGVRKNARRQQATVTCTSFSGLGRTEHSGISAPPHMPHTRGILIFCKGFTLNAVHGTKMSAYLQQRNGTYTLSNAWAREKGCPWDEWTCIMPLNVL